MNNSELNSSQDNEYNIEKIVGKQIKKGHIMYLVKWDGFDSDDNTWERADKLTCHDLITAYENKGLIDLIYHFVFFLISSF